MAGARAAIPPPLNLRVKANPDSVTQLRHEAGEYAFGLGGPREKVETFVSEAVGNAVKHAYRETEPGFVSLEMQATFDGRLLVSIVDKGVGMRPDIRRKGLGFGLALMAAVSSSMSIEN